MSRMLLIVVLMTLAGCGLQRAERVPAQCNAMCFRPCVGEKEDTGVRVQGDPASAATWDEIGGEVNDELARLLRTCDVRRQACEQCLRRLDAEKVIELKQ